MTRAADIARADVEESKRSGPPDSAAGRGWSAVILVATDLFDYLDWQQQRPCAGGRLVRRPRRLPEALEAHDVAAFMADLRTSRDRGITLLMLLGGLRAAEVRSACLREERPPRAGAECFVVLRGPTVGQPLTEAGLRRIFRTHRHSSGALRVRPRRLRHTYGTELVAAGIDAMKGRGLRSS